MALNSSTLESSLIAAFASVLWSDPEGGTGCAELLGTAFDNYIKSGTLTTVVTGSGTTPGGSPFAGTGTGTGAVVPTGLVVLQQSIAANLVNPAAVWADSPPGTALCVGRVIATAIDVNFLTAVAATTVLGPTPPDILAGGTGAGAVGCVVTAAVLSAFISNMVDAFTLLLYQESWATVAEQVAIVTTTYLTGAVITTVDEGTIPASGWTGTGVGTLE